MMGRNFLNYSKKYNALTKSEFYKDSNAFSFLMNSGKERLMAGYYDEAYYEFKLAYKIDPEDEELQSVIIETISILCSKDINYCKELDFYLKQ